LVLADIVVLVADSTSWMETSGITAPEASVTMPLKAALWAVATSAAAMVRRTTVQMRNAMLLRSFVIQSPRISKNVCRCKEAIRWSSPVNEYWPRKPENRCSRLTHSTKRCGN
jgi:hypothetical protein